MPSTGSPFPVRSISYVAVSDLLPANWRRVPLLQRVITRYFASRDLGLVSSDEILTALRVRLSGSGKVHPSISTLMTNLELIPGVFVRVTE
jgi:hypothetical protein